MFGVESVSSEDTLLRLSKVDEMVATKMMVLMAVRSALFSSVPWCWGAPSCEVEFDMFALLTSMKRGRLFVLDCFFLLESVSDFPTGPGIRRNVDRDIGFGFIEYGHVGLC